MLWVVFLSQFSLILDFSLFVSILEQDIVALANTWCFADMRYLHGLHYDFILLVICRLRCLTLCTSLYVY